LLLASVHRTTAQSYRADATGKVSMSVTGPYAEQFASLTNGKPTTVTMHFDAESATRASGTTTIDSPLAQGGAGNLAVVVYDGAVYVSSDGGRTYQTMPTNGPLKSFGADQALGYLNAVGAVTDHGHDTVGGRSVERYRADIDDTKIKDFLKETLSSFQQSPQLREVFDAMEFTGGHIDAAIDANGYLVEDAGVMDVSMDFSKVDARLAGTKVVIHEELSGTFSDYGTDIKVTKPTHVSGTYTGAASPTHRAVPSSEPASPDDFGAAPTFASVTMPPADGDPYAGDDDEEPAATEPLSP
jgi:hypothetical protein